MLTVVLDNVWGLGEIGSAATGVGIVLLLPLIFITGGSCFLGVLGIQRYLAKDGWGAALAKAFVMGAVAGVPFQVTGTAAGAFLLSWAGLSTISRFFGGRPQPPSLPDQSKK